MTTAPLVPKHFTSPDLIRPEWKIARGYYDRATGVLFTDEDCDLWEQQYWSHVRDLQDYYYAKNSLHALRLFMGVSQPLPAVRVAGAVTRLTKEQIKEQVKLSTAISTYAQLRSVGGDKYQAQCPFHKDRVSSLSVDDKKGLWNCFAGCGGGDLFSFIMKVNDCSFRQALDAALQYLV